MNSKFIIGTLVGGLLFFIWQSLSWTVLDLHGDNNKYTPKQQEILAALTANLEGDGEYFLPTLAPGFTSEQFEKFGQEMVGKPWATIQYHSKYDENMGMNMGRGLLVGILAIGMLIWLLSKIPSLNFSTALMCSLAVGLMAYLTTTYTHSIWFNEKTLPDLIDAFAAWGLVGCWLGWWLNRK